MESHQLGTDSHANRYPGILAALSGVCGDIGLAPKKILSFGCSHGFEPLDLKTTFPDAAVHGCDVNRSVLAKARERCESHGIVIFESTVGNLSIYGPYDLIVAMSVLCRHPDSHMIDDISGIYPFATFSSAVCMLDVELTVRGLLVIYNSNYFFEDTPVAARYAPVATDVAENGFVDRFLPSGRKLYRREVLFGKQLFPTHVADASFPGWRADLPKRRRLVAEGGDARLLPHMVAQEAETRDLRTVVWQKRLCSQ